jgi:hypothetical protein
MAVGIALVACTDPNAPSSRPVQLVFTVQPNNATAGVAISPVVAVAIQDASGDQVSSATNVVTMTIAPNASGGRLAGTTIVAAVNGVATFSTLSVDKVAEGYTLTAAATGLTGARSTEFAITAAPAARLAFTMQPSNTLRGDVITPPVQVAAQDSFGNLVTEFRDSVTLTLGGIPGTLSGTTVVTAINGVATFSDLSIDQVNAGYTLSASAGVLTSVTSVPFNTANPPVTLHVRSTTTGLSFDPDGYRLCVDPVPDPWDVGYSCTTSMRVGVNSHVTLPLGPGTHDVQLDDVAANCTVREQTTVEAGDTTEVSFVITCVAAGAVHVTTVTTGIDVDPSYGVCIVTSGTTCAMWSSVPPNSAVTIAGVIAGPQTVTLTDVATNCAVSGATTRAVTIPQDGTVDVAFDVGCVVAERIAFSRDGMIVVSRADASDQHVVTPGLAPAWSPNGARLAYECGQDICAINADGTGFARLTMNGAGNHHPTWAPDGAKIAFAATHDLYVMGANGSGAVRLTQGVGFQGSPAWSPDGTKIAFDCVVDAGNEDICSVNANGTGFARLTSDRARDFGATWRPDGSTLAFATTRYGADEIALLSVTRGSVTRIGAGLPGFEPTWSLDGTQLALVQVSVSADCDYWCSTYDAIFVATSDGAAIRYLTAGRQPAWKPHP